MNNSNEDEVRNKSFNFYRKGTLLGVISGLLMTLIAVIASDSESIASSFLKYVVLLPFLAYGLVQLKNTYVKGNFFKEGILFGIYTSFIAALAFAFSNTIAVTSGMRTAEKFSYEAESFADVIGFQGISVFEITGLGMILTFICLQFLKFTGTNENVTDAVTD